MFDLRKLFVREARAQRGQAPDPDSDYHPSDRKGEGLELEYQSLIATQFRRWGISTTCVSIEVRRIGHAPDGFDVLVGMVRLAKWERLSALRVLVGLPLLESKVRRAVRGTWLADYSHFGGLWLHASERVNAQGATAELRELLMQLAPPSPPAPGGGGQGGSGYLHSSVPPSSQAPVTLSGAGQPSSSLPRSPDPASEIGDAPVSP
jgi:hypothetical protein